MIFIIYKQIKKFLSVPKITNIVSMQSPGLRQDTERLRCEQSFVCLKSQQFK